jgi:type IV pilus assembly protein PilY1
MNIAVRCALAAMIVAGSGSVARADITLSETPLFLSTSVTPNVMLLFDNSGSMDNMMWAPGYDPGTDYRDWSRSCGNNDTSACWSASDGNVFLSEIPRGDCSNGWKQGRRSNGTRKCLRLPSPRGNSTRYNGNYLNYLFDTYSSGTNLTASGTIPQDTRLETAKDVSVALLDDNDMLRWGLARFNPPNNSNSGPGGQVIQSCGAALADVKNAIDGLTADSNTPLAETFYEITRYFRGLSSYYNSAVTYTSPIQYRCQKNFVIVVTDGFPTYDTTFPGNDEDDNTDATRDLPNWDNLAPSTSPSDYPLFRQYSDGFKPSGSERDEGYSLYLDDLAKFGYDIDLRKTGNDQTGVSFNDTRFRIQRLQTYPVGLALDNQMLRDAAAYSSGKSFTANTSEQLQAALAAALKDIEAVTSSAASITANSTRVTADTAVYQARFKTSDWSGQLLALPVESDGDIGEPLWDAADQMPAAADRSIYTYKPDTGRGRRFEWNQLSSAQQAALNRDADGTTDNQGSARLAYLRGDRSNEGSAGLGFRVRSSILGDIVNSDPAFAGQQNYGFTDSPFTGYAAFRSSSAYRSRPSTIYVGANDGMLHAFRASDGVELFAYVPSLVYERLSALTDPDYDQNHKYLVDGPMKTLDAYLGNSWKTVLLGALGAGGRGVFALDVTDPASFDQNDVMWEFTSAQDGDMGYSYPQPTIARTAAGWVAVVANGYNSANGKAVLFLLDLEDGSIVRKLDTAVAGDNGLSSPIPVDVDGDRVTDLVYAGDLKGNLWKFDLRSDDPGNWKIAFGTSASPLPLFTACDGTCDGSNSQPITARPEVGLNDPSVTGSGGYVVYFGTGRYFAVGDNSSSGPSQSFYGIYDLDNGEPTSGISGREALQRQEVVAELTQSFGEVVEDVRITTNNPVAPPQRGWYLDLPLAGERQVSTPILRKGSIIFTTLIPDGAVCAFGGDSFVMELQALTGSRYDEAPFDLNLDNVFDDSDNAVFDGERVAVSGRRSSAGIIKTPVVAEASAFEVILGGGSGSGDGETPIDRTRRRPGDATPRGRLSWRQMQ